MRANGTDDIRNYLRFGAMIATSMLVMHILMYFHTYEFSHVRYSETRLYMTFLMGAGMAVVMLAFMSGMYRNRRLNLAIYASAAFMLVTATWLVRSQELIGDSAYMKGMIPHHSIAILTSDRAKIRDMRVRELADGIILAQRREIMEMNWLLEDIRMNGPAVSPLTAAARPVPDFTPQAEAQSPAAGRVEND